MFSKALRLGRRASCPRWPDPGRRRGQEFAASNVADNRQLLDEEVDERRIERAPRFVRRVPARSPAKRRVIRTFRRDVEVVHNADDARADRDGVPLKGLRIAGAVPAFVVAEDDRRHRIGEGNRCDDLRADLRMDADLRELLRRQRAGLRQDVCRDGELADVVQQCRRADRLDFAR